MTAPPAFAEAKLPPIDRGAFPHRILSLALGFSSACSMTPWERALMAASASYLKEHARQRLY